MESEKLHRNTLKSYSNNYTCKSSIKLTTRVKKASFFLKKSQADQLNILKIVLRACLELKKNNSPFFHYRIKFLSMNKLFSIVKNIQGGGEGWLSTPSEVFLSLLFFSKRIKHQNLTLSVTVPLSLAHFKTSSVMFSFYGYEI